MDELIVQGLKSIQRLGVDITNVEDVLYHATIEKQFKIAIWVSNNKENYLDLIKKMN